MTLYSLAWAGLAAGLICGSFRRKALRTAVERNSGLFSRWAAPVNTPAAIGFGLIPLAFILLWASAVPPHMFALIKPLEERAPFVHYVLDSLVAFAAFPGSVGPLILALYLYQRKWDKLRSQDFSKRLPAS